jgi:hypothetical protein
MPRRPRRSKRLATAVRWPAGIALTSWRYLWRTTPMHRVEERGDAARDCPPPLPRQLDRDELQVPGDGAGPLFHRCYRIRVRDPATTPEALLARVREDPDRIAPSEFASFQKVHGEAGDMRVGDEYVVRMPGPWDGPVRVIETTPTSFRLATLQDHLEAGQIEFRAGQDDGLLTFEIESWARSGDRLSHLLYDRVRMAKEIQLHMWVSTLERIAKLSGGARAGRVEVHTRRVEEPCAG